MTKPYKIKKNDREHNKRELDKFPEPPEYVLRHISNEAKRLLLDSKYEELRRPTDEDLELSSRIAFMLSRSSSTLENGPTLFELTMVLFKELKPHVKRSESDPNYVDIPDEIYNPKEAKVVRAINLLEKMALEAMVKDYERYQIDHKDTKMTVPFYIICQYNEKIKEEVYYDGYPITEDLEIRREALHNFYKTLGFDLSHIESQTPQDYEITHKGSGMIKYTGNNRGELEKFVKLSKEDQDKWYKEPKKQLGGMSPNEFSDIIDNLKGNYTSEEGLNELIDLFFASTEVLSQFKKANKIISQDELMHILIPASINASGSELLLYKTKMEDLFYFAHRYHFPPPKYESRLYDTYKYAAPTKIKYRENKIDLYNSDEVEITTKAGIVIKEIVILTTVFSKKNNYIMHPDDLEKAFTEKEGYKLIGKTVDHIQLNRIDESHNEVVDIDIIHKDHDTEGNIITEVDKYTIRAIIDIPEEDFYTLEEYEQDHLTHKGFVSIDTPQPPT